LGNGAAVDSSGNSYTTYYNANLSVNVVNYINSSGVWQWSRSFALGIGFRAPMVATDSSGNAYLVAWTTGMGGLSGINSAFILKLNSSGTVQWQRNFAYSGNRVYPYGLSVTATNGLVIGMQLGTDSATAVFVKLPVDGSKTGTYTASGYSFVYEATSLTINNYTSNSSASSSTTLTSDFTGYNESVSLTYTESADTSTSTFTTI
jgi:hypothetical protein